MRSYPPPDDEERWQELMDAASSDVERNELQEIRARIGRGRKQVEEWERDHPPSRWHRFLARIGSRSRHPR
jgi:hypothetical protein